MKHMNFALHLFRETRRFFMKSLGQEPAALNLIAKTKNTALSQCKNKKQSTISVQWPKNSTIAVQWPKNKALSQCNGNLEAQLQFCNWECHTNLSLRLGPTEMERLFWMHAPKCCKYMQRNAK